MDLDYPKTRKDIELDAAMRFSEPGKKLEKMFVEDISGIDFRGIDENMRAELKTCPLFKRSRKVAQRFVREICRRVEVKDLPEGKRKQWVNDLASELYRIMKSDRPLRKLHNSIEDVLQGFEKETMRYLEKYERIEQEIGKGM